MSIKLLISEVQIQERIHEIAKEIVKKYKNEKELTLVTVLQGGKHFSEELVKEIEKISDVFIENFSLQVSSYGNGTESSGHIEVVQNLNGDITGKNVIIIEDIIDSGFTLKFLKKYLQTEKQAHQVEIAVLLNKPNRRKFDVEIDFVGFEIPDEFVVGCGLDFEGKHRELRYVGVINA